MLLDFNHCDLDELEADVCVVGAGPAGLALVRELLDRDVRVLLVDSGGVEPAAALGALNGGENVGPAQLDLESSRRRVLGGTSTVWAGQCVPLEQADLEVRSWVPGSGWPLTSADLDPWYRRVESLMGIERASYGESNWRASRITAPALDRDRLHSRFTVYPRRANLGELMRGRLERDPRVRVLLHATAVECVTAPGGATVESVRVRGGGGREGRIAARRFVLSAGTVENTRLLLVSNAERPAGLGNANGALGRYLQDHPNAHVATVETSDARYLQDRYALLYRRGRRLFPRALLSPAAQERWQAVSAAGVLVFEYPDDSGVELARALVRARRSGRRPAGLERRLLAIARDAPAIASLGFRRYVLGRSPGGRPSRIRLQVFTEQPPRWDSRIDLASARDPLGVPLPRVDWRLGADEGRAVQAIVAEVAHEFGRLGIGRVTPDPWVAEAADHPERFLRDAYHHIGTTRMARDPRHGVVDPDLRVHGTANLFVAGASTFPTSSWINPTMTAMALSARLGAHLARGGG